MMLQQHVLEGFKGKHVIVIGDAVADQFLAGTISRVSREAPVFILRHDETITLPGAAANAAANVAALGGEVTLFGFCGADANGSALRSSLGERQVNDGLLDVPGFSTTTKVRVLAGNSYATRQQVIRIDYEEGTAIGDEHRLALMREFSKAVDTADAIIVSDYGCGVVSPEIFKAIKHAADDRDIPLVIDSRHRLEQFAGAISATPNREEVEQILGSDFTEDDCSKLRGRMALKALLVTNGNQGMTLFEADKAPVKIPAVGSTEPVDVTGAGDTVIATYALGLAAGMSFREAADVANHAGGIVVMKKGTATVTTEELVHSLNSTADQASLATTK
ncbi:MAG: bifunctional heptose 7-phosphate kinase/heptose 1-phosphate adenyltransferase [Pyrinomonadaceae bacterium]